MLQTSGRLLLFFFTMLITPLGLTDSSGRADEDYYKNDIDAAIREAKQNPRQFNYAEKSWYKRTTAESFEFPPLMGSEMDAAVVEGGINPSAAGAAQTSASELQAVQVSNEQSQNDQNIRTSITSKTSPTQPDTVPAEYKVNVNIGTYTFSGGDSVSTSGIYSSSTLTSSTRP